MTVETGCGDRRRGAGGGEEREPERGQPAGELHGGVLVRVADGEERAPASRQRPPGGALGLGEGGREVGRARHHFAGRAHLRAEHGVGAGEAGEREDGGLDADRRLAALARERERVEPLAGHQPAGRVDEVHAGRLARERNGARGAGVGLEHEEPRVDERELDVHQPDDAERRSEPADDLAGLLQLRGRERDRREHAGGVARVDAGLLDVLHDRRRRTCARRRRARRRRARARPRGTGRRGSARRPRSPPRRRRRRSRHASAGRRGRRTAARAPGSRSARPPRPPVRGRSPSPRPEPLSRGGRRARRSARGPPRGRPRRRASRGSAARPPRARAPA